MDIPKTIMEIQPITSDIVILIMHFPFMSFFEEPTYSVVVKKESLTIELRSMKGECFSKSFSSSDVGEFSLEAESNKYSVQLVGVDTKGSCKITIK